MKIEWTADNVYPGIVVGRPATHERWMIGYAPFSGGGDRRYTLNSLTDGMVQEPRTKAEMAAKLTDGGLIPADILDNPRFEFPKPKP